MNQTSSFDQSAQRWDAKGDIRWKILIAVLVTFLLTLLVTIAVMSINVPQPVSEKALDPLILENVLARRYEETKISAPASEFTEDFQESRISPAVLDNVMRRRYEENVLK